MSPGVYTYMYLSVLEKVVKEMVDDVRCEHSHTKVVRHFLSISLHSNIKC